VLESDGPVGMSLLFDDEANDAYGNIYWGNETDGNADGRITYFGSTYVTAGDRQVMSFRTAGTERMRIKDGKVSIGTTAVASATSASLHVADPSVDVQAVFGDNLSSIDDPQIRVIGRDSANSAIRYLFTGLDADANHGFIGYNAGSGAFVNALTFDTSGQVGIGTSDQESSLHIAKSASGARGPTLTLDNTAGSSVGNECQITFLTDSGASVAGTSNARIKAVNVNAGNGAADLRFDTWNGSAEGERVRITSSGSLLVNETTAGAMIHATNANQTSTTLLALVDEGGTGAHTQIAFANTNGQVGTINTTGSSTAYNTSSDYRLKENITDLTNATDRLKQLAPKRFNFKADADTTVDGFIAHEVSSIVPEAITGTKDAVDADGNPEYQGIDQSKLVPLLVATIKELEARIAALESE
jgi:hypothetical protein